MAVIFSGCLVMLGLLNQNRTLQKNLKSLQTVNDTYNKAPNPYSKLSHAFDGERLIIKLGDQVYYKEGSDQRVVPALGYNSSESIKWVDHSISFVDNPLVENWIFDMEPLPDNKGIIVVVESSAQISKEPELDLESRSVFRLNTNGTIAPMSYPLLSFFSNDFYKGGSYPRIAEISADGKFVAFDMYNCWGCHGHRPEKIIVRLESEGNSDRTINLGEVEDFAFNTNNTYSYRAFPVACYEIEIEIGGENEEYERCLRNRRGAVVTKAL